MTQRQSNLRYTVGERYPFVLIQHTMSFPHPTTLLPVHNNRFNRVTTYLPWDPTHCLHAVVVKVLTCVEHRKVPYDHDPNGDRTCDGFIFRSDDGEVWYNQFPYASYGQTSTVGDSRVRRHFCKDDDMRAAVAKGDVPLEMEDAFYRIAEIQHGMWTHSLDGEDTEAKHYFRRIDEPNVYNALHDLCMTVQEAVEAAISDKIVVRPLTMAKKDGTREQIPGLFEVDLQSRMYTEAV